MDITPVVAVAFVSAVFVGFNIGGSSTGVSFGPAVGTGVLGRRAAAVLMSVFVVVGGNTIGRNVIDTIGKGIVAENTFSLLAAAIVLSFVGSALLISNLFGVPASTSMTTVGATAGMGVALGAVRWNVLGEILMWWLISPILAFWICAVIGRYLYDQIANRLAVEDDSRPVFRWRTIGRATVPVGRNQNATRREVITRGFVVTVGCYMAFTAGASNVANAVGPLFGAQLLGTSFTIYVVLGASAIALGAFSIAQRTLETVGTQLTSLSLPAAMIVEIVGATLITLLSWLGIPASLAVSTTMCVIGLGWGRETRTAGLSDTIGDETTVSPNAESTESTGMYDGETTGRVIALWLLVPSLAAGGSYVTFYLVV